MAISFSITLSCSSFSGRLSKLGVVGCGCRIMAAASTIKVVPSVIVGGGRVGRALANMGDGEDVVVKRGEPVPVDFAGPILVCTRNDDLEAVLDATPPSRWSEMGYWSHGLKVKAWEMQTKYWLILPVSKLGEALVDGKTDTNPEGLTAAYHGHLLCPEVM